MAFRLAAPFRVPPAVAHMHASEIARQHLEGLLDHYAGALTLRPPLSLRSARWTAVDERAWREGFEAERVRAVALLADLRKVIGGPEDRVQTLLQSAVGISLESADRWAAAYRAARHEPGCMALFARAELAARLASSLREIGERAERTAA